MRRLLRQLAESGTAFREVFANPGLRRIQLAWAASILGTWAYGIAVVVYAYDHGGAAAVGGVGVAPSLGGSAASPVAAPVRGPYHRRWGDDSSPPAPGAVLGGGARLPVACCA